MVYGLFKGSFAIGKRRLVHFHASFRRLRPEVLTALLTEQTLPTSVLTGLPTCDSIMEPGKLQSKMEGASPSLSVWTSRHDPVPTRPLSL